MLAKHVNCDEREGLVELELRRLIELGSFHDACVLAVRGYGPEIFGFLVNVMDDANAAAEVYSQFIALKRFKAGIWWRG